MTNFEVFKTPEATRKHREGRLSTVAACASALAAMLSLWISYRLEDATYRSQLYNKQVDSLSAFIERTSVLRQEWGKMRDFMLGENYTTAATNQSVDNSATVYSELSRLNSAAAAVKLVYPEAFYLQIDRLVNSGYDELINKTRSIHIAALEKNWHTKQYEINNAIDKTNNFIKLTTDKVVSCAYATLKQGRSLSDEDVSKCSF